MSLFLTSLLSYYLYLLKLQVFVLTKAVSNRDICFIKAVLILREHGHFSLSFAKHGLSPLPSPPHNTIRVKLSHYY